MKKLLKRIIITSFLACLFMQSIDTEAAVAGYSFNFSVLAKGYGARGISGNATKGTNFSYAQVIVKSLSKQGYSVHAYAEGPIRTYDYYISRTGSYALNYTFIESGNYSYGGTFRLCMHTTSSNPYNETIKGTWTP